MIKLKLKNKESDNTTTLTQMTRDGEKPCCGKLVKESENSKTGKRFEVVLIEEGMGNFGDAYYYPGHMLQKAAALFEGKKMYANHPSKTEEHDRPERDVKQVAGYFENVKAKVIEGRTKLVAEAVIPDGDSFDWARDLMREDLEYQKKHSGKSLIGLSINAGGMAERKSIHDLLKDSSTPQAAKEKLNEALELGIESVNYTTEITDAQSVDLVTEAGAGGKINKMLEGKNNMEATDKDTAPASQKPGGDTAHPDAEQDKALVADMLKKHLGDDAAGMDEAALKAVHETFEAYKEMGHEAEDAAKMACAHHKVEKQKQAKKEADDAASGSDAVEESEETKEDSKMETKESSKKVKESETNESEIVKLTGRVAFLESELKKERLEKYIDKKLRESGLPRSATDALRKQLGDVKTEKDFDSKLGIFLEGYKMTKESESPYFLMTEKSSYQTEETTTTAKTSLEDCLD